MAHAESSARPRALSVCVSVVRPRQWVKNFFVFAPLLFTPSALSRPAIGAAFAAFAAFCFAASALYVFNDILDREADRKHPLKRLRPIASGALGLPLAWIVFAAAVAGAGGFALVVPHEVAWVVAVYLAMNLLYTLRLKQVPILDVMTIAIGFVMRVTAGAAAIAVTPSPWMLECVGLIALFLAVAKRRDDLLLKLAADHRASLSGYSPAFLDMCMGMVLGCLLALYIVYSASGEVIARIGTDRLYYTVPFVVAGIMRYLQITIVEQRSGAPTDVVTSDPFLIACMVGWLVVFSALVYV